MAVFRSAPDHAQKKTAHASEQDRADIVERRWAWFEGQLDFDPERLVFIDETWASTNMARRHGRCRRGERLRASVPHGHWKTTTFVAGLRRTGMVAPIYLPPYSPDFNPIEQAFSKLKAHLRKAAERTIHDLWTAIGRMLNLYSPAECANFFANCGYDAD